MTVGLVHHSNANWFSLHPAQTSYHWPTKHFTPAVKVTSAQVVETPFTNNRPSLEYCTLTKMFTIDNCHPLDTQIITALTVVQQIISIYLCKINICPFYFYFCHGNVYILMQIWASRTRGSWQCGLCQGLQFWPSVTALTASICHDGWVKVHVSVYSKTLWIHYIIWPKELGCTSSQEPLLANLTSWKKAYHWLKFHQKTKTWVNFEDA